jgi:hypothetical protein
LKLSLGSAGAFSMALSSHVGERHGGFRLTMVHDGLDSTAEAEVGCKEGRKEVTPCRSSRHGKAISPSIRSRIMSAKQYPSGRV